MKWFYFHALQSTQLALKRGLRNIIRNPDDPHYGKLLTESGLPEPASSFGYIECAVALYISPDSDYYKNPNVLEFLRLLCIGAEDGLHEDGTDDLLISNFHQPEYFHAPNICMAYRQYRLCYYHFLPRGKDSYRFKMAQLSLYRRGYPILLLR